MKLFDVTTHNIATRIGPSGLAFALLEKIRILPVSIGLAIIGTTVMNIVARVYKTGQIKETRIGLSHSGCFQRR